MLTVSRTCHITVFAEPLPLGSSMASNYNTRNKAAEVLINEGHPVIVREREQYQEQFSKEKIVHDLKLNTLNILEEAESQEDLANNNS